MKIRAVVITVDGKRYLTRWCKDAIAACRAAERLALRRNLKIKEVRGQSRWKSEKEGQKC